MKLKTNNKFSTWLFKLACKLGYKPIFEPKVVYITPKNFIKLSCAVKVPNDAYILTREDFINRQICYYLMDNEKFKQSIKLTSKFNPEDFTTTVYAELYILNKEKLEDFYERY